MEFTFCYLLFTSIATLTYIYLFFLYLLFTCNACGHMLLILELFKLDVGLVKTSPTISSAVKKDCDNMGKLLYLLFVLEKQLCLPFYSYACIFYRLIKDIKAKILFSSGMVSGELILFSPMWMILIRNGKKSWKGEKNLRATCKRLVWS